MVRQNVLFVVGKIRTAPDNAGPHDNVSLFDKLPECRRGKVHLRCSTNGPPSSAHRLWKCWPSALGHKIWPGGSDNCSDECQGNEQPYDSYPR